MIWFFINNVKLKKGRKEDKSEIYLFLEKLAFCVITSAFLLTLIRFVVLQVRAAPPPPKQQPRRPHEKSDKTEEVEITLV